MALPPQLFRALRTSKIKLRTRFRLYRPVLVNKHQKSRSMDEHITKILGEGGFSFVYLAQDEHSGRQFALKKIPCPTGKEGVKEVMREVEACRRFKHPNIIRILDSAVVQDPEGEGQIVYLFLPLYKYMVSIPIYTPYY